MTEPEQKRSAGKQRFPALYPILDAELALRGLGADRQKRRSVLRQFVQELAEAGVEILEYRNKLDEDGVVAADARSMREAAAPAGLAPMRLILNDRAALAPEVEWDGVHVGQEDLPPRQARLLVGENALVGLSTHNEEQIIAANREPVDYIAIGPVFATASKRDTSPVIGLDGVRRARALTRKPLVAIGGITLETAASVYAAGADSLAVIAAIFAAPGRSPAQSAKDFLEIFK
ncbi:MAG: thiamine phosphate synthase [Acidobacteriaceae bacterium]